MNTNKIYFFNVFSKKNLKSIKLCLLFGLFSLALTNKFVLGHGIVESAVERYRAELSSDIQNIELRQKLIHALQETQHYDEALAEIEVLRGQAPNKALDFESAFTNFEKGDFQQADVFINAYLKNQPNSERGLTLSGRAKLKTSDYQTAISDLTRAISINPKTDLYLYRSKAYTALGDKKGAIRSLQDGVDTMGNLTVFMTQIVTLQQQLRLYPQAIKTIDKIINTLGPEARTEHFVAQKADLLKQVGQVKAANELYQQAYTQLNTRSVRIQNLASSKKLKRKLIANLPQQSNQ